MMMTIDDDDDPDDDNDDEDDVGLGCGVCSSKWAAIPTKQTGRQLDRRERDATKGRGVAMGVEG